MARKVIRGMTLPQGVYKLVKALEPLFWEERLSDRRVSPFIKALEFMIILASTTSAYREARTEAEMRKSLQSYAMEARDSLQKALKEMREKRQKSLRK